MSRSIVIAAPISLVLALITTVGWAFPPTTAPPASVSVQPFDGMWSVAPTLGDPEVYDYNGSFWSGIIDSQRDRMIVRLMPLSSHDPLVVQLDLETLAWTPVDATGTPPDYRYSSAIYDSSGDRIILFGGRTASGQTNETWALELSGTPQWVQLFPSGPLPAARERSAAILDTRRNRMIVIGGVSDAGDLNDVWALSLTGPLVWSQLAPTGASPPARGYSGTVVYDEIRDRMVVCTNPIWILSLDNTPGWASVASDGAIGVPFHDVARNRLVGFWHQYAGNAAQYWALDLGSLQKRELFPFRDAPGEGTSNSAIALQFDPRRHRLVHFGLNQCTGLGRCLSINQTWLWSFGQALPVFLTRFTGERVVGGIRLSWQLTDEAQFSEIWAQRKRVEWAFWSWVNVMPQQDGDGYFVVDQTAEADLAYDYRVVGIDENRRDEVLGPPITVPAEGVGTLVTAFVAERTPEGIRISWTVPDDDRLPEVWVERSDAGGWGRLNEPVTRQGGSCIVLDRSVRSERKYAYRLVGNERGSTIVLTQPIEVARGAAALIRFLPRWNHAQPSERSNAHRVLGPAGGPGGARRLRSGGASRFESRAWNSNGGPPCDRVAGHPCAWCVSRALPIPWRRGDMPSGAGPIARGIAAICRAAGSMATTSRTGRIEPAPAPDASCPGPPTRLQPGSPRAMTLTSTTTQLRTSTRPRLFTPGPVEIPNRVLRALSQVPPHHRTEVFRATYKKVTDMMRELHGTEGEVFLLAASGTGAMEAAVVNLMSPGEKALVVVGGKFGERWQKLLEAFAVPHDKIDVEWGRAVDPGLVEKALEKDPSITTVFATHSETSTGAIHDVEAFAKITKSRGKKLVLDAMTSLGIHPLPQDAWGIDAVVTGSQKGLMAPPGVASISIAPWAASAIERGLPRFYFDLRKSRKSLPLGESPWTPAVSLLLALEEALTMMREEGLEAAHERHRRLALATRAGAQAAGFAVFSSSPSNSLTAITGDGIDMSAVVKRLRDVHGMVVAGGQDHLKGKILRIGHMGAYDLSDIVTIVTALEECATAQGKRPAGGAASAAVRAWESA